MENSLAIELLNKHFISILLVIGFSTGPRAILPGVSSGCSFLWSVISCGRQQQ